jgi:hypothetical protein
MFRSTVHENDGHTPYLPGVKPDVFTNNRISSLLDTMKPSAEIIAEYVRRVPI